MEEPCQLGLLSAEAGYMSRTAIHDSTKESNNGNRPNRAGAGRRGVRHRDRQRGRAEAAPHTDPNEPRRANGFSDAAEAMQNSSHKSIFMEYAEQRRSFVQELLNDEPIDLGWRRRRKDGSALAALHRAWISVKAALTSGDHAILEAVEAGEDHTVKSYAEALEIELPADVDGPVRRQYTQVKAAHDKVRAMRDASV